MTQSGLGGRIDLYCRLMRSSERPRNGLHLRSFEPERADRHKLSLIYVLSARNLLTDECRSGVFPPCRSGVVHRVLFSSDATSGSSPILSAESRLLASAAAFLSPPPCGKERWWFFRRLFGISSFSEPAGPGRGSLRA